MLRVRIVKNEDDTQKVQSDALSESDDKLINEDGQRSLGLREEEERTTQLYKDAITNPLSGIRAHCVECMGGHVREIAQCTANDSEIYVCSLYQFRSGTNTLDIRTTDAYKAKMKAKQEMSNGI